MIDGVLVSCFISTVREHCTVLTVLWCIVLEALLSCGYLLALVCYGT
jgi:hypothetical protein